MRCLLGLLAAIMLAPSASHAQPAQTTPAQTSGSPTVAFSPPPPPARGPGLGLSDEAARRAIGVCAQNGYQVAAVVVDSTGALRAALVADRASSRYIDIAMRKAFTAITFGVPTSEISVRAPTDAESSARIAADPRLIARTGARLLRVGDTIVGAIGVSGAPGGDKDDVCAAAAVERIQPRLR